MPLIGDEASGLACLGVTKDPCDCVHTYVWVGKARRCVGSLSEEASAAWSSSPSADDRYVDPMVGLADLILDALWS